ncbi:MAG: glutathione S-transferase family protein [Cyanobacteriota bacterium]
MINIYTIANAPSLASSAAVCLLLLEELGVEYSKIPVDFSTGSHKKEEYTKLNPNGKIPCIDDDGFILWESMAINDYLCLKYKPEMLGKELQDKALISQWNYWGLSEYRGQVVTIFVYSRMPEDKKNPKAVESAMKRIGVLNELLEKELEGKEYLVGNTFTLADLNVGFAIWMTSRLNIDISNLPNLSKYVASFTKRDAFQKLSKG